jgi:GNAT superfamily N-acetyltransferase
MDSITFENHSNCCEKTRQQIIDAVRQPLIKFNRSHIHNPTIANVLLTFAKQQVFLGGLIGRIAYDWLHVELLWLDDSIRKKGYGKILLRQAEEIALSSGCIGAHLDTFSFQAPDFYIRLGYEVFGQIENHPKGETRYYLKKMF